MWAEIKNVEPCIVSIVHQQGGGRGQIPGGLQGVREQACRGPDGASGHRPYFQG